MKFQLRGFSILLVVLIFATFAAAQQPSAEHTTARLHQSVHELDSKLMGRKMPYMVSLPTNYDTKEESGRVYPTIYLLHGLNGGLTDWPHKTGVNRSDLNRTTITVFVEGGNGWYTDNLSRDSDNWESYIIRELIPEVERKFRANGRKEYRAIAGLSMGGYGAIKFGLKHPEMFSLVGSFSGALGAAGSSEWTRVPFVERTLTSIFGPPGSELRKANDIFDIVRRASSEKVKEWPFIYLDCGTEDFLLQNNRDFVELLVEKKVSHEYRQLPGGHDWEYWSKQIEEFLAVANRHGIK